MSKHAKMARAAVPPPQSRGVRQMPVAPGAAPVAVRQEIGELDALKYRLAIQKDNNLKEKLRNIEGQKALLAKEEENVRLRIELVRMENRRDIGHLDIGQGDNLVEENGRFYILRAPRQGTLPTIKIPPKAGPIVPEPPAEVPPAGVPPANPEGEEEEGEEDEEEGATEGNGAEASPKTE
jgi:hypothetical protein